MSLLQDTISITYNEFMKHTFSPLHLVILINTLNTRICYLNVGRGSDQYNTKILPIPISAKLGEICVEAKTNKV